MEDTMKKNILLITILLLLPNVVFAKEITNKSTIEINNKANNKITDNNENTFITINPSDKITITSNENIHGIYILYERQSSLGTITNQEKNASIGTNAFLHEYVNVEEQIGASTQITIEYQNSVKIAEIYVLSEGELPDFVEQWNPPCEEADLLLFSTHSDDEQLFFLGLLPTYVAQGKKVQVVYFTNHYDNPKRLHEQLHGLYTVGITSYPIIGIVPDAYSESLEGAIKNLQKAELTEKDTLDFEVEMLRRFKPLVVVGHDELGEYSHGQHILNTHILKQAILFAEDENYELKSNTKYEPWSVPKTYLHLYKENQIIMDYDTPLEYFGGRTAYEVSKEGYKMHLSQQYTWFTAWMNGKNNEYTKSTQIKKYSPLEFGLYRSLVGEDNNKNDMFENITKRMIEEIEEPPLNNTLEEKEAKDNLEQNTNTKNNQKIYFIGTVTISLLALLITKRKKDKKI